MSLRKRSLTRYNRAACPTVYKFDAYTNRWRCRDQFLYVSAKDESEASTRCVVLRTVACNFQLCKLSGLCPPQAQALGDLHEDRSIFDLPPGQLVERSVPQIRSLHILTSDQQPKLLPGNI